MNSESGRKLEAVDRELREILGEAPARIDPERLLHGIARPLEADRLGLFNGNHRLLGARRDNESRGPFRRPLAQPSGHHRPVRVRMSGELNNMHLLRWRGRRSQIALPGQAFRERHRPPLRVKPDRVTGENVRAKRQHAPMLVGNDPDLSAADPPGPDPRRRELDLRKVDHGAIDLPHAHDRLCLALTVERGDATSSTTAAGASSTAPSTTMRSPAPKERGAMKPLKLSGGSWRTERAHPARPTAAQTTIRHI